MHSLLHTGEVMGIDIYLEWEDMDAESKKAQITGFCTTAGGVGYLREAYHGGPYATRILVREAFEDPECAAQIPAAVMKERLTSVTEPTAAQNGGHFMASAVADMLKDALGAETDQVVAADTTRPMTVYEAITERYTRLYPDSAAEYIPRVIQSFYDFVALAEEKEKQTGKPCTVIASY